MKEPKEDTDNDYTDSAASPGMRMKLLAKNTSINRHVVSSNKYRRPKSAARY